MDKKKYYENLNLFKTKILNKTVSEIFLLLDENPQFDLSKVPFKFEYCNKVLLKVESIFYELITAQNEIGTDTFWFQEVNIGNTSNYYRKIISSKVCNISYKNSVENYSFKIEVEYYNKSIITLFAAEIYDNYERLEYKLNDEMILYFDNQNDVNIFEKLTTNNASR